MSWCNMTDNTTTMARDTGSVPARKAEYRLVTSLPFSAGGLWACILERGLCLFLDGDLDQASHAFVQNVLMARRYLDSARFMS